MLDNTPNQTTEHRTKNWVERNDNTRGTYNKDSPIKFKTAMLQSSLCDYSDAYILVKGTKSTKAKTRDSRNNGNKEVLFQNFGQCTDCMSEINNT